ncbi:hypothetical protein HBA54_25460 [Pelagibius litoralis]|uniref:histidine kinase n=1 Tax=Pelagibius litoralis TaxID=374515 RepID=A0A967KCY7_9PROT|nr:ATP-binding protein [Pelagibius litoralis]NIA71952.1 hypothetical protein [Pelagibius litoralis]
MTPLVLGLSLLLQFTAAAKALLLTRVTGWRVAWVIIAVALVLMGGRRSITLLRYIAGDTSFSIDLTAEIFALIISALMLIGVVKIGGIFTAAHRSEEALKDSRAALQVRVTELETVQCKLEVQKAALARAAAHLAITRDQADAASRAKSDFLANMSHELRTPLNAIIGFSEMMKDENRIAVSSARYRDYSNDIHNSGKHLLDVINDILDLSKVESGSAEVHTAVIDVPDMVASVLTLLRHRAREGGVALVSDLPDGLPLLHADSRKVKQILVNLTTNAIKFTAAGGQVTLRAFHGTDGGFVFQVADTGIGIAAADIPVVLSQFGQVNGAFSRGHGGTGLGLPLSKSLAELHGGGLELESAVGRGTTVTVCFPAARVGLPLAEFPASRQAV